MPIAAEAKRPKVGLGVCLVKNGKVLLGKRLNAHGEGSWGFPGGHLEFGESFAGCAKREVKEETGLEIKTIQFVTCTNDVFLKEDKHYITIYVQAQWIVGKPQVLEPDKMITWQWFAWDNLPSPLFLPIQNLLKTGYRPQLLLKP